MSTYEVAIIETIYTVHHVKADSEEIAEECYWETDPVQEKIVEHKIVGVTKIQPRENTI
jgi:hypothetical protein